MKKSKTPRNAKTFTGICLLPRSSIDIGDYWLNLNETTITVAVQKCGCIATEMTTLPRSVFEHFADWYNTGIVPRKRRKT